MYRSQQVLFLVALVFFYLCLVVEQATLIGATRICVTSLPIRYKPIALPTTRVFRNLTVTADLGLPCIYHSKK
uniref:Secreted protein n=1 Tax=Anguilla anguilla TaxID=7936 RepID=A0A0E9PYA1_ANGAN